MKAVNLRRRSRFIRESPYWLNSFVNKTGIDYGGAIMNKFSIIVFLIFLLAIPSSLFAGRCRWKSVGGIAISCKYRLVGKSIGEARELAVNEYFDWFRRASVRRLKSGAAMWIDFYQGDRLVVCYSLSSFETGKKFRNGNRKISPMHVLRNKEEYKGFMRKMLKKKVSK